MRVGILGAGGVGGLLAALLARQGDTVTCVVRDETAAALASGGISMHSDLFGDISTPVGATTMLDEPVDACFVTVKATQLDAALDRLHPDVLAGVPVVPLLNGVEHVAMLRSRYPSAPVVPATIRVEVTRTAPGVIEHASPFAKVELATDRGTATLVQRLAEHLQQAGLDVAVRDDETAMLWGKLVFLAPMAVLTTHAAANIGVVRSDRRDELVAMVEEIASVAAKLEVSIDAGQVVAALDAMPASMQSSMQRDAQAGRPIELEAIGGAVLRSAARVDVGVPVTARLVDDLRSRDAEREERT